MSLHAAPAGFDGPVRLPTEPPTWSSFLVPDLQPVPVLPVLGLVLAAAYVAGVARLRWGGRRWPWWQTLLFLSGCLLLVLITGTRAEAYGFEMFSVFMFQQLTLMIAIPPLLILGRPGTLFLRAVPHRGIGSHVLRAGLWGLRSAAGRVVLHPAVTVPLFLLAFYGLYFGPAADLLLASWAGHLSLEVAFLAIGVLFTAPVLSSDPLPRRHGHGLQIGEMFVEMAVHAFFGVIVIMAVAPMVPAFTHPPLSWGIDVMGDQAVAGALAWSYGELPALVVLLIVLRRWFRSDSRAARAKDLQIDRDGNPDLDAYNDYLRGLSSRSEGL
jgi:putative membrane protein